MDRGESHVLEGRSVRARSPLSGCRALVHADSADGAGGSAASVLRSTGDAERDEMKGPRKVRASQREAVMTAAPEVAKKSGGAHVYVWLGLILCLAAFLRLYQITVIPP